MMFPELPIGSPERAEVFRHLRETFTQDWKAAAESVRREREEAKGDLYFVRAGDAVKIGRTTNIVNRLGKIQADNHEEVDCVLLLKGEGRHEAKWHKRFSAWRIRGEWFRWSPEIAAAIEDGKLRNRGRTAPAAALA